MLHQFLVALVALLLACSVAWQFKDELRAQVWALGSLPYNPGGLRVPLGYNLPTCPYSSGPAASLPAAYWQILLGTASSYNGQYFTLRRNEQDGTYTEISFKWYVTTPPISPFVGINVTGLTTTLQIRNATAAVLRAQGFNVVTPNNNNLMLVQQPFPGNQGDVGFFATDDALVSIGPQIGYWISPPSYAGYGQTVFFGGFETTAPLRIGRIHGMGPVTPPDYRLG